MNRPVALASLIAVLSMALSACASTPTPVPTATPLPQITPLPCPEGQEGYADSKLGFSACYPSAWQVSQYDDPEDKVMGVDFLSATDATNPVPKRIAVRIAPIESEESEEKILEGFAIELMNRRSASGRPIVPIAAILIDGHNAAQDTQEGSTYVEGKQTELVGWVAGFPARQRMWYINVSGPSESKMEVEDIYKEFIAQFHLVP